MKPEELQSKMFRLKFMSGLVVLCSDRQVREETVKRCAAYSHLRQVIETDSFTKIARY